MRYLILLISYVFVAILLGLGFLFPEKPVSMSSFAAVVMALVPLIVVFDVIGQTIIDNERLASMGPSIKPIIGAVALAAFIGIGLLVVDWLKPATVEWF